VEEISHCAPRVCGDDPNVFAGNDGVKDHYFISPNKEYANKFAQDEIDYLKQDKRFKEIDLEALKEDINE
jgi:hypothetical protein